MAFASPKRAFVSDQRANASFADDHVKWQGVDVSSEQKAVPQLPVAVNVTASPTVASSQTCEASQTTAPARALPGEQAARRSFEAFSEDQLSLDIDAIIVEVNVLDDFWAYGKVGDKEGKFPRHVVKTIGDLSAELRQSPAAQYELGVRLVHGSGGLLEDTKKGVEWHTKAALSGSVMGMLALAWHNGQGIGVALSKERAQMWLGLALMEDVLAAAVSFHDLGISYEKSAKEEATSAGVAFGCYHKSALAGYVPAMASLGRCYQMGVGVAVNPEEAYGWYQRAAALGNIYAEGRVGCCYSAGIGVRQDVGAAATYFRKAADKGDACAQYMLGRSFKYGDGLVKDYRLALFWFRRAAQQGHVDAANQVGLCYEYGWGSHKNSEEALLWFKMSAEAGGASAQASLGWKYALGHGVQANGAEAVRWTTLAAEQGEAMGQFNLAAFYQKGWGVQKDEETAKVWLKRATTKGYKPAVYELKRLNTWKTNAAPISPLQNRRSLNFEKK